MIQLILHLWGDYLTQSHWMSVEKTKRWWPALLHSTIYSLPFFLIGSWKAVLVIWSTHVIIDRFRVARYVVWAKNFLGPRNVKCSSHHSSCQCGYCLYALGRNHPWIECSATGYHKDVPAWLSTWLMILADNTLHLTINYLALAYL